jgi:hypothetical protein
MDPGHPHDRGSLICQHRIEVEVWPPAAEACFRNERFSNPVNTKVQFEAHVFNAPTNRVTWAVHNLDGGAGAGSIDAGGLYLAPDKGSLPYGFTDIVVAASLDDPSRRAYAKVSVVGLGPLPPPPPRIEVYPRRVELYYPMYFPPGVPANYNAYIDSSNTMQLFRALVRRASPSDVQWTSDGGPVAVVGSGAEYMYKLPNSESGSSRTTFHVQAALASDPAVVDQATVTLLNYWWPGIVVH